MKVILYVLLGIVSLATVHVVVGDEVGTLLWFLFYASSGFKVFEGKRKG
jgi:hypothetical protein